ncbi:MAG: phospholipid-binding protein MlaC [Pikeienuella sp.]
MTSNPRPTRRLTLKAAIALPAVAFLRPAWALTPDDARGHVRAAIDEVLALAAQPGAPAQKAGPLQALLERYAAMDAIARFAAGLAWREMSPDQQTRYTEAFKSFISKVYARRFTEYSGQSVTVTGVEDAGRRGLRVLSRVSQTEAAPIAVAWMVTDRPGRVLISDIIIEEVSLIVTQREEIGAMLSSRGGDVERLISDLAAYRL